ncbi:MAG: flagellar hook-basal body complex protein FliE [Gammaproteobacteria bacterium]|nr:flagellar hook-basal body complex protein FliE [Gammaproteobacteria bacterium]
MSSMEINKVLTQMRALQGSMGLPEPNSRPDAAGGTDFGQILGQSISKVNEQQAVSQELITGFQTGTGTASVAEVMVAMQKASLSFTAMTQVRNKLVDAYQEIMNMPI